MTLAAGNLNLDTILYIAAAVWGVISWWRNKNVENVERQAEEETPPQPEIRRTAAPPPAESEAERMRRFLEALGVPGGQQRPVLQPPVQRPPVQPPVQRPVARHVPRPRPVARPKPAPIPEPEEVALAGRIEEPARSFEGIGPEFDRRPGGVVLPAIAELATRADVKAFAEVSGENQVIPTAVTAKSIHTALRSPDILRTAFVLREVLGPPRCEAV